jgi:hypothetical protein
MLPEQTIHDLHELHEERVDLVIQYRNAEYQKQVIDRKQGWLIAFWLGRELIKGGSSRCSSGNGPFAGDQISAQNELVRSRPS